MGILTILAQVIGPLLFLTAPEVSYAQTGEQLSPQTLPHHRLLTDAEAVLEAAYWLGDLKAALTQDQTQLARLQVEEANYRSLTQPSVAAQALALARQKKIQALRQEIQTSENALHLLADESSAENQSARPEAKDPASEASWGARMRVYREK